jgi:hypothetical protein
LPAGLMPRKGMVEAWLEARRVKRRFQGGNLRKRDRLPLALIDLADYVWLCNTADLDRAEIWHDGGASGPHNREALGNGDPG